MRKGKNTSTRNSPHYSIKTSCALILGSQYHKIMPQVTMRNNLLEQRKIGRMLIWYLKMRRMGLKANLRELLKT
jgi:hypothetical protein